MKNLILCCLLFVTISAHSQSSFAFTVENRNGFEHNLFNAHPNQRFITDAGDTIPGVQSSLFTRVDLRTDWKLDLGRNRFIAKLRTQYHYFPQVTTANLFRPEVNLGYNVELNDKTDLFFEGRYLKYQTNRFTNEIEAFRLPPAYRRLALNAGIKLDISRNHKSRFELSVFEKKYDPGIARQLQYQAVDISYQSIQLIRKPNRLKDDLRLKLQFQRRHYQLSSIIESDIEDDIDLIEDELEGIERERLWQYHTLELNYTFAHSKIFETRFGGGFQQRLDLWDERFGYRQWKAFAQFEYQLKRFKLAMKGETWLRTFSDLSTGLEDGRQLKHVYYRAYLFADYELSDQIDLLFRTYFRQRVSNIRPGALTFQGYTNAIISVGVKFRFEQKRR